NPWLVAAQSYATDIKLWREGEDVVVPEDGLDFGEVGFREIGAGIGGAIVYAADFERQRVGLGGNDKICPEGGEFGGEAIANVQGHAECSSDNGHAESEGRDRQHLAARAARDGVGDESGEHEKSFQLSVFSCQ